MIKTDVMIERVAETVSFISCDFKPVPLILTASQDSLLDTSEPRPIVSNLEACYPRIASSRFGMVLLSWWRIGMQMLGVPHQHICFFVPPGFSWNHPSRDRFRLWHLCSPLSCVCRKQSLTVAWTSHSSTIAGSSLHCLESARGSRKLDS